MPVGEEAFEAEVGERMLEYRLQHAERQRCYMGANLGGPQQVLRGANRRDQHLGGLIIARKDADQLFHHQQAVLSNIIQAPDER